MRFRVKNRSLRLLRVLPNGLIDGKEYNHLILKLTVKNGEQYALDMTGAQLGWQEALMPWDIYAHFRIQYVVETLEFGEKHNKRHANTNGDGDRISNVDTILNQFAKILRLASEDFQERQLTFKKLLDLPEGVYKARTAILLDNICHHLEAFKAYGEDKGLFRI